MQKSLYWSELIDEKFLLNIYGAVYDIELETTLKYFTKTGKDIYVKMDGEDKKTNELVLSEFKDMEIWLPIQDLKPEYEMSSLGNIRLKNTKSNIEPITVGDLKVLELFPLGYKEKEIKYYIDVDVLLKKSFYSVHRLLLEHNGISLPDHDLNICMSDNIITLTGSLSRFKTEEPLLGFKDEVVDAYAEEEDGKIFKLFGGNRGYDE